MTLGPTQWHPDARVFQLRTNRNPRRTVYSGPDEEGLLSATGETYWDYISKDIQKPHRGLITYKALLKEKADELEGVAVANYGGLVGLDTHFKDVEVLHVLFSPEVPATELEWQAKTLFGDAVAAMADGNVKAVMASKGVSQTHAYRLTEETRAEKREQEQQQVLTLHQQGKSIREIANQIGLSRGKVERILKNPAGVSKFPLGVSKFPLGVSKFPLGVSKFPSGGAELQSDGNEMAAIYQSVVIAELVQAIGRARLVNRGIKVVVWCSHGLPGITDREQCYLFDEQDWAEVHGDIAELERLLRERETHDKNVFAEQVIALHKEGLSERNIAEKVGCSRSKVYKILRKK